MQLASDVQIPDGLLAEMALLSEKPPLGFQAAKCTVHQGLNAAIYLNRIGDTTTLATYSWQMSLKAQQQPASGEGSAANEARRAAIADKALALNGDTSMPYTADHATCNLACQRIIKESGAPNPLVKKADGSYGAPSAAEWAGSPIPNWRFLKPGEAILPGDVAARKENFSDATGHSGIVVSVANGVVTVIAAHATHIGVDMSFQPDSTKYNNVYRRYTGD